jgi:predicted AlkP superfamily pyrophosphatase or phosphodiesterase
VTRKFFGALYASVVGFLCALALVAQSGTGGLNAPEQQDKPYLVLVSLDGFRADYLDRFELPNLRRVMRRGTRAKWMNPVFPTLTFPNHYSLVTGLHPGRHGIVGNSFFDPVRKQKYVMSDASTTTDGTWYSGEPIWVTAETQGMVAACYFWPGSEAAIKGVRPTFVTAYDGKVPNDTRVQAVLDWLGLPPGPRPHMITLYFSEVDAASHDGPLDSPNVERAAQSLDRSIGMLLDGLDALPIRDRIHLLLTSDHGMASANVAQVIPVESVADLTGVVATFDGPVTSLHVGDPARAIQLRDQINSKLQHGRAYLRQELPERFQYREDPRGGDVIAVMEEGWTLRRAGAKPPRMEHWGTHGWDPALASMRAVFVAMGPTIRAGVAIEPVENVDVYPFMTELLGLRAAAGIDGRSGRIASMVRK